jgi:hypothetical protein
MAAVGDSRATGDRAGEGQKLTRPGGQPGGSGAAQGWMRRPCRTQDPQKRFQDSRAENTWKRRRERGKQLVVGLLCSKQRFSNRNQFSRSISSRRYGRGRRSCRKRRTGEPSRSGDSRRSNNRRCWRRSPSRRWRRRRCRLQRPSPNRTAWPMPRWWWMRFRR